MRVGISRKFRKPEKGKAEIRCADKVMCDIQLAKSALWCVRRRSRTKSKEAFQTLMEDREFSSASRGTGRWVITGEARGKGATYGT